MANDALKRASRKARRMYAEGALVADVPVTSDDPQMEAMARAQKPVTEAVGQQLADDYANRLTYEQAVAAAKGDKEAQAKVHEKSLGFAMGAVEAPAKAVSKALNMNPANRMVRAEKMGFGPDVYYHGTPHGDIQAFDPHASPRDTSGKIAGFFTKEPKFANKFTEHPDPAHEAELGSSATIFPVHLKVQKAFDYENPSHVQELLKGLSKPERSKLLGSNDAGYRKLEDAVASGNWAILENPKLIDRMRAQGFDGMHVLEDGTKNIAVFEPSQIRSKFAEFDPSKKGSGNISYAEGGEVAQPQIGYNPIQSDTINYDQIQAGSVPAQNINVLNHSNELVSIDPGQLHDALNSGYKIPTPEEESHHLKQQEFGTPGQQAVTALEGAAEAASFGTSTGMERALGISTPERITARREVNPGMHMLGQVGGLAASALIPVAGEANILRAGGQGLAKAVGLTGAGLVEQVGAQAVKGAFEMALLQGGSEISKAFAEDPNQTAETAIADIGLATVMGGVFGGSVGAALGSMRKAHTAVVSELDRPAMEAGTFESAVKGSGLFKPSESEGIIAALGKAKKDAPEIQAAAERLGAPVMEGMISDSRLVQKAEDALINGVPTYSGIKRQEMYKEGFRKATQAVDGALGEGSTRSKAEIGQLIKDGLTFSLEEQNKPIAAMYDALKASHQVLPLAEDAAQSLGRRIEGIQELRLSPSSPEGQMARRVLKEIEGLKTVDDIKTYKSILNRSVSPTASSGEKRMKSVLSDMLTELEEGSIEAFARKQGNPEIQALIPMRKAANAEYKQMVEKVQTLSEQLGKGRIHGVQDAVNFIQDLTPEQVTNKLFAKNNSQFLEFFQKEFPEQMDLMRSYQKGVFREEASRTGELSPKLLFNKLNKLEPEIKEALFSKGELQALEDAETYIRAMPKNFNPSGTAHMDAMRSFFEHPMGAAMANVRDMGLEKFIKLVSASPEINQAITLAKAAVKGEKAAEKGINNIFKIAVGQADDAAMIGSKGDSKERSRLDKLVSQYIRDPEALVKIGDNNPLPEFSQTFAATSARAVQYLGAIKPDMAPKAPLDSRMPANDVQKAKYERALDTAANPLSVLNRIKDSTLTVDDVATLNAIYPSLYTKLSKNIQAKIVESVADGKTIPYVTRMGLSTFLGEPLDSTLTPMGILGAQGQSGAQPQGQPQGGGQGAPPKKSSSALSKVPQNYQTSTQTREARRQKP